MKTSQMKLYKMFKNMFSFGFERTADLPDGTYGNQLFVKMGDVIAVIENSFKTQLGQENVGHSETKNKDAAENALMKDLKVIRRTAKLIAKDNPGFNQKF